MKNNIPRIPLAQLPTPFYKLENISAELGRSIYIKRDDMTGVSLGGNKVRKLEYLLADAKEKGCDVVITTGGAQSNHAMLTAACCRRLGIEPILMLKKRGVLAARATCCLRRLWMWMSALWIRTAMTMFMLKWISLRMSCARQAANCISCLWAAACRSARLGM